MPIISQNTIRTLEKNARCNIDSPISENIIAHIIFTLNKDHPSLIEISARLMAQNPRQVIDGMKAVQGQATFPTLEVTTGNLCRKLKSNYAKLTSIKKPAVHTTLTDSFKVRVLEVPGIGDPSNFAPYVKRGWNKETAKSAITYLAHTCGRFFQENPNPTEEELSEFQQQELADAFAPILSDSASDETLTARQHKTYNNLCSNFYRARAVQQFLLEHHPEGNWPQTLIPLLPRITAPSIEPLKTITFEQYVKLCCLLKRLCQASVPHAYAGLLQAQCGTRIGESCAPLIGEFQLHDNGFCGRYYVQHQTTRDRQRTDILKNEYSYRYVYFCKLLCDMIELRKTQLQSAGYSLDDIATMPFASTTKLPKLFLNKNEVSHFLRTLLVRVGCDAKWLESEAARIYCRGAIAGTKDDLDPCAHKLRSTLATFYGNGGIPSDTLDAILGHKNLANLKKDYASESVANTICSQIDRTIYLGSLCGTTNPAYQDINVQQPCQYHLHGNNQYIFTAETDCYLMLNINSLEPASDISLQLPKSVPVANLLMDTIPNTLEHIRTRPILQPQVDPSIVEKWIEEAMNLDITDLIEVYGEP